MRIRRNASKLLGPTTLYAIPPATGCPSAAAAAAAAAVDAECREGRNNNNTNNNNNECELSCSPWDLLIFHHHHHNLNCSLDDCFLRNHHNPKTPPACIATARASVRDRGGNQDGSKEVDIEDCDDEGNATAGGDRFDDDDGGGEDDCSVYETMW